MVGIEYQVEAVSKVQVNLVRIAQCFSLHRCGGRQHGLFEGACKRQSDRMIGNPDADGSALGLQHARNFGGGTQNEGVGPRQEPPHDPVGFILNSGITRDIAQIRTYEGKEMILGEPFEALNALNRFFVENAAADAVRGVGRVGDNAATVERLNGSFDFPWRRKVLIDLESQASDVDHRFLLTAFPCMRSPF